MKKLICSGLTLSLALFILTTSYAQEGTDIDILRAADVNADGMINILDLVSIASYLGEMPPADVPINPDVNGDGDINILDLVLVASYLGETVRLPVAFVGVNPVPESQLEIDGTIILTFDGMPEDVAGNIGVAKVVDNSVTLSGPFPPGPLVLIVTWADGTQTLRYTVREPDTEPPQIIDITAIDSDGNIEPKPTQNTEQFEITFNETVIGQIILRTAAGTNVGWSSTVEGNKGLVERGYAKALNSGFAYLMDGNVIDTAGNEISFTIDFTTAGQTPDIPVLVDDTTFETVVLESELPVVVEFYAVW